MDKKYHFEGSVIKLNRKDYLDLWNSWQGWKQEPDYIRKLYEIDMIYAKDKTAPKNWWHRLPQVLRNEKEYLERWSEDINKYHD